MKRIIVAWDGATPTEIAAANLPAFAATKPRSSLAITAPVHAVAWPMPQASIEVHRDWAGAIVPVGAVQPFSLEHDLWPLRVQPEDFQLEDLQLFLPRISEIDQQRDPRVAALACILADTATLHAAAVHLAQQDCSHILLVRYSTLLAASSLAGPYFDKCREAIYRYLDLFLARLQQLGAVEFDNSPCLAAARPLFETALGEFRLVETHRTHGKQSFLVLRDRQRIGELSFGRTASGIVDLHLRLHHEWRGRGWGRQLLSLTSAFAHGTASRASVYLDEGSRGFLLKCGWRLERQWHRHEAGIARAAHLLGDVIRRWPRDGIAIIGIDDANRASVIAFLLQHIPPESRLAALPLEQLLWRGANISGMLAYREGLLQAVFLWRRQPAGTSIEMLAAREDRQGAAALGFLVEAVAQRGLALGLQTISYEYLDSNYRAALFARRFFGVELRVRQDWISTTRTEAP